MIVNQQAKCILCLCTVYWLSSLITGKQNDATPVMSSGLWSVKAIQPHTDPYICALILLLCCSSIQRKRNETRPLPVLTRCPLSGSCSFAAWLLHHHNVWWQYFWKFLGFALNMKDVGNLCSAFQYPIWFVRCQNAFYKLEWAYCTLAKWHCHSTVMYLS